VFRFIHEMDDRFDSIIVLADLQQQLKDGFRVTQRHGSRAHSVDAHDWASLGLLTCAQWITLTNEIAPESSCSDLSSSALIATMGVECFSAMFHLLLM
jgi:hypothetical protein